MSEAERREHPRINFEHSGEALIQQRLSIELVNLSAGGMAFKSKMALELGSTVNMVLFKGNLSVESRVCSCDRVDRKKDKFRIGVSFTKVSSQLLEEVLEMEKRFDANARRIGTSVERENREIAIFRFPERLTALDNEEMMKSVQEQLDESVRHFVMDFSKVDEMDDGFFSQLVEIDEEIRYEGGVIIMASSSSQLLCTPQASQLSTMIPIFESVDKAVTSINSGESMAKEEA